MKRDSLYTFFNTIILIKEHGCVNSDLQKTVFGCRNMRSGRDDMHKNVPQLFVASRLAA